jgi:hypothetical protein
LKSLYYQIHIGFIPYFVGKIIIASRVEVFSLKYEKNKNKYFSLLVGKNVIIHGRGRVDFM